MTTPDCDCIHVDRRTVLKSALAAAAVQLAPPFIRGARGEAPLRIGLVDPLTGVYAAVAQNEVTGARLAVAQINARGGILGRPIELLVEDSANDVGTGVQKARKLIERDQVSFLIGDVNSGIAQAIAQVSNEKKVLHIVSGGHTDTITGSDCKWNVYRVCNTTSMEANAVANLLFSKYGKKWHFITPDYAFGHTLQKAAAADLQKLGGTITGNELTPLGTTDFSAYLIKARAANPDVLVVLPQGSDMVNCLKQIAQFGIGKQMHIAGLQQELESLEAMPPEARVGIWMFEWYWKQPGVPGVEQFVADIRKVNNGKVPTARHWFGFTSVHTLAAVANREKTLDSRKLAEALSGFALADDVKLQPNKCYYRKGDHQLMTSSFVGEALSKPAGDPEDLFRVDHVVPGDQTAPPESATGCTIRWPA
ncbi:ABC transporter substrate-binding protein [Ralstonia solanacearum]|uniref:Putative Leu/Ile/Val-binding periplasmic (PBP) ABC transporter protein n=1 Tax=Ralstonia solanacearum CFBP2957 TaxID=859656 RepID=D8P5N2_RALSL|nr:ABC transporter substrate-binding protein [Ralstonia solanacearum]AST35147.2 ABC transporter substrate-binding protein [Ralstonia solanacearum]AYB58212.1 ABC transporter substrate-binding protein [Ralstonia solanacearum]MDB0509772.1 ABC transporter substrate-binding protein [Ralstonia solanacearum]MDB0511843.1 ABC transporter substrate-binding protein [Ralstonia solanacearum]MDB0527296.1 ABC transporter substrate-binding protein [Ralstonia solanacearum]